MVFGTLAAYNVSSATASHWAASSDIEFGHTIYIGLSAVVLNLVIAVVLTLILRAARVPEGTDETLPGQYTADPEQAPAAPAASARPTVQAKQRPFNKCFRSSFFPNGPLLRLAPP